MHSHSPSRPFSSGYYPFPRIAATQLAAPSRTTKSQLLALERTRMVSSIGSGETAGVPTGERCVCLNPGNLFFQDCSLSFGSSRLHCIGMKVSISAAAPLVFVVSYQLFRFWERASIELSCLIFADQASAFPSKTFQTSLGFRAQASAFPSKTIQTSLGFRAQASAFPATSELCLLQASVFPPAHPKPSEPSH